MLDRYSGSYYIGNSFIDETENDKDIPKMSSEQFTRISTWYKDEGAEPHPVLRMGDNHFTVFEGEDLPMDTVKIPEQFIPRSIDTPGYDRFLVLDPGKQQALSRIMDPEINSSPF